MTTRTPPEGFIAHRESTTSLLIPAPPPGQEKARKDAFINPVQEYNRDLSIAAIRTWAAIRSEEREAKRAAGKAGRKDRKGKRKAEDGICAGNDGGAIGGPQDEPRDSESTAKKPKVVHEAEDGSPALPIVPTASPGETPKPPQTSFTILEALSATGLRAIRYAKEIPGLRHVVANDLSPSAVEAIKRNIVWNSQSEAPDSPRSASEEPKPPANACESVADKISVSHADATALLYAHRSAVVTKGASESQRFDVIDLDPYGTAAPFIDGAVQAVADGGLLCITCTDLGVLAGSNYPEKCYANYGGTSMKAEYSHEAALRLVLHSIASSAARYGRHIEPLLSLSIDFYVRLFIRVYTSQAEAKKTMCNTALINICNSCQMHHLQPLGKLQAKPTKCGDKEILAFRNASAVPPTDGDGKCTECGGSFYVSGPMWSGPLHSAEFTRHLLAHIDSEEAKALPILNTAARIKGMVSVAHSESLLNHTTSHFYFTPSKVSSFFHCAAPSLSVTASALLHGGYEVSRSHCVAGSIKTTAPRWFVHDVMRKWIESNPVKMENIKEGSPARVMLAKESKAKVDLDPHGQVASKMGTDVRMVRYQANPSEHWGPKQRART